MSYRLIRYEITGAVATLTLNRPDRLNCFNEEMCHELINALRKTRRNEDIRALLLRGEGKVFSAGQDLREFASEEASQELDAGDVVKQRYNHIIRDLRRLEIPVVCAVQGVAAGAAANIALACDFVIAGESAGFVQAFTDIGLIPDSGGTFFLPRLLGLARATELLMLAENISAQRAYELGLIYRVYPDDQLESETNKLLTNLAKRASYALGLTKRAINESLQNSLNWQLDLEGDLQRMAARSADHKEGIKAFLKKRKPKFEGK